MEAKDRQINEKLSKFLPEYVLQSLATFQKEAVKFIMEKKGRALVGDVSLSVNALLLLPLLTLAS